MKRSSIDVITGEITESEIPQEEIDEAVEANKIAFDALSYGEKRASEYPPMADQLDYIYHNGVAKWKTDIIDPVKTKYPKG